MSISHAGRLHLAQLRIAFVVNRIGAVEIQSPPLLAALARRDGHEVDLFDYGRNPRRALRDLKAFAPDIIAYSVCSNEAAVYLEINRELKKHLRFFAVFGGPHPTHSPERTLAAGGVDAICRGEGDVAFPEFLRHFGTDTMYETPNFGFRLADGSTHQNPLTDLIEDLDSLPYPARDLLYRRSYFIANNPVKGFGAGRGCPYQCSYCFNHAYNLLYRGKGKVLRNKSVDYVIGEIKDIAERYPLSFARFYDDNFGLEREWLEEFATRFPHELDFPFSCYVRPNAVTDEHARLLKKAGCHAVYTAIECANEHLRNEVLRRRLSDEQIIEASAHLKAHGIRLYTFNMVGIPGETEQDIMDTVRFNRQIGADFADASVFQPYPGTEAHTYCVEHGYLSDDADAFESMYTASVLDITPAFKQRIFVLHKLFTFLVDHPRAAALARLFPRTPRLNGLLSLLYRLYYGYFLHKRIYMSCIPFWVRLRGAITVLLTRNRN